MNIVYKDINLVFNYHACIYDCIAYKVMNDQNYFLCVLCALCVKIFFGAS